MTSHIVSIKLNNSIVDIDKLNVDTVTNCADSEDITNIEVKNGVTTFNLYGIRFIFMDNRLSSFLIMSSNDKYENKVVLIDSFGQEYDIQDRYNLMSMVYFNIQVNMVKGMNVSPYVSVDDFDNISCKITRSSNGFSMLYEVLSSNIMDNMYNRLKALKNKV